LAAGCAAIGHAHGETVSAGISPIGSDEMAATNKCLACSNKSLERIKTT
jgi:hypothetical protein